MKNIICIIYIIIAFFSTSAFAINFNGDNSIDGNNNLNQEITQKPQQKQISSKIVKIDSNQKINKFNVQFFFSYSCIECYYWHKELEKIKPKLAQAGIDFILQPIIYDKPSDIGAQLFYALKQTNNMSFHNKLWDGLANQDWSLSNLESLQNFINSIGGNGNKIVHHMKNDVNVKNLTLLTPEYTKQYQIKWPPNVIISGRYAISKATINDISELPQAIQDALNSTEKDIKGR